MEKQKKEAIFNENEKLIWSIIHRRFSSYKSISNDLYQVGAISLWKAIDKYESKRNTFGSYAGLCIFSEIKTYVSKLNDTFNSNSGIGYDLSNFIYKNKNEYDSSELYLKAKEKYPNINIEIYNIIYSRIVYKSSMDDENIYANKGEMRLWNSEENGSIEEQIEGEIMGEYYIEKIRSLNHKIEDRYIEIYLICLNNKINNGKINYRKVGTKYGISGERVRQIYNQVNKEAKKVLTKDE